MARSGIKAKRDSIILLILGVLTIIATLITAVPGFLSLKAKHPQITFEARKSQISFPTNTNGLRIKEILDREGIPDASFIVALKNSGDQPAAIVNVSISALGKVIAASSRPSPQDHPPWVNISDPPIQTNKTSVTCQLKGMAVGPKLEIEVNYCSIDSGVPKCEIYADGILAQEIAETTQRDKTFDLVGRSIAAFVIGLFLSTLVFLFLRMNERPELKDLMWLVVRSLFPRSSKTAELASQMLKTAMEKPSNAVLRFNAMDAELHGDALKYENGREWENIGYWASTNDYVIWKFNSPRPIRFLVVVEQSCIKGCGGKYEIIVGSQRLAGDVQETGSWKNFIRCKLGNITVQDAGEITLKVQAVQVQGGALMNLRLIILQEID